MILVYAMALCLFAYNIRFKSFEYNLSANNLTKDNTDAVKGICSVLIVFHHLALQFKYTGILSNIFNYFGGVSVGLFFFLSAYGLRLQYEKYGGKYLKKILLVKIPKLYLYLVIVNVIYYFVFEYPLMEDEFYSGLLRILGLDWTRRPNQDAWYMYTLIVMYALFAAVFSLDRFIKNKNVTTVIMALLPLLYIPILSIISKQINYSSLWLYRRNIHLFSLGILYASYKNKIDLKLRMLSRPLCIGALFVCILGLPFYCEDVVSVAVVILVVIMCMFVSVSNSAINFVGKISLQLYLTQRMFIRLFDSMCSDRILYSFSVIICVIASSAIIYGFDALITKLCKRKRQINVLYLTRS